MAEGKICYVTYNLPDDDDEEVEHVPAVTQIGAWMKNKSVGNHLHDSFQRENYDERIFQQLLQSERSREDIAFTWFTNVINVYVYGINGLSIGTGIASLYYLNRSAIS